MVIFGVWGIFEGAFVEFGGLFDWALIKISVALKIEILAPTFHNHYFEDKGAFHRSKSRSALIF